MMTRIKTDPNRNTTAFNTGKGQGFQGLKPHKGIFITSSCVANNSFFTFLVTLHSPIKNVQRTTVI